MAIFVWSEFTSAARQPASSLCNEDDQLSSLLAGSAPPEKGKDHTGKPLPGSVSIDEHPDRGNFKRALAIRDETARRHGQSHYVAYSGSVLTFLDSLSPAEPLYVVVVATLRGVYEFLYAPQSQSVTVHEVGSMG